MKLHTLIVHSLAIALAGVSASAADAPTMSAKDLASKLSALQQDNSSYVRLKMTVKPPAGTRKFSLQLQIKQRRTRGTTEVVYQVLWPKERAGEAVLLKQTGNQTSGSVFIPPNTVRPLSGAQMKEALFGSDLTYADVLENFFSWDDQKLVGIEVVNRVSCQVLESKPGKGRSSGAAVVRTWVDTRRLVPLRVEKFLPSGTAFRRIETTRVASDDINRNLPANLTIHNLQTGSATELEGSKLKHGVKYADREFTPEGLKELAAPASE